MLKRYETHNKLLNLWNKLFPDVTCNDVDKGDCWHRLRDSSHENLIMLTATSVTAWRDGVIVLCIELDLLPFNL